MASSAPTFSSPPSSRAATRSSASTSGATRTSPRTPTRTRDARRHAQARRGARRVVHRASEGRRRVPRERRRDGGGLRRGTHRDPPQRGRPLARARRGEDVTAEEQIAALTLRVAVLEEFVSALKGILGGTSARGVASERELDGE